MTGSRDEWRFAGFVVKPAAFCLLHDGEPVRIEPRALEVLIYLIERRERIVTKQELLDELWKGTAVTENALTRAVAQVRKVLGDDLQSPRFIQTIPTKGYRFVGEIAAGSVPVPAPPPPPAARAGWRVAAATFIAVAAMFAIFAVVARTTREIKTIKKNFAAVDVPPLVVGRPFLPSQRTQVHPSFSPDGLMLAYSADVDGIPHIFTSPVSGVSERQITTGDGETQPAWSPDGTSIAFVSIREPGIWIVPAGGGRPQRLTTFGTRPSWSPDGNEIAFQSSELMDYGWTAFEALPPSTIHIANVKSKKIELLTRSGAPRGGHGTPSWRADGRRLAFSSCDIEQCAIYTVARDGHDLARIISDGRRLSSPLFSPDGKTIHFILGRYNNSVLQSVSVDDDAHLAGVPRRLRESNPGVMQHLAISRDGRRFAWTLVEESSDLYKVSARGGVSPVRLTNNPSLRATFPAFSRDGSKIAWCAVAAGEDSGAWVMDSDGRNAKAVAVGSGLKQHTGWMPREWDVVYAAWQEGPALLQASLLTGRSRIVSRPPRDASSPVIAPDGTTLAFNRTIDGVATVWTDSKQVTSDRDLARFPVWSPSGRFLAVQVRRPEGSAVGIVPAAGGALKILTDDRGESHPYSFSPDEREVAFAGRRDGLWNIYAVNITTGATRRLTDNRSATTWFRSPSWSPANDEIVYEAGVPKANVWLSQ